MQIFDIIAMLITLVAVFSWVNHRFLRLPTAIGLMAITLAMSLGLLLLGTIGHTIEQDLKEMLFSIDFDQTLLHGMLSFLLFAGALHVNMGDLANQRWVIAILATASVIGATFLIGFGAWFTFAPLVRAKAARADIEITRL